MKMKIKPWAALIVFLIGFPVIVTLIFGTGKDNESENYTLMEKEVIINRQGYERRMDVEKFIPCVLAAQMRRDSPKEALMAHAIVIRTYIVYMLKNKDSISSEELALPYVTYEQMLGNSKDKKEFVENYEYLTRIIEKTNLKIMKSGGKVILPLFHGTSAGKTRNGKEVLGEEYSYLLSTKCESDVSKSEFLSVKYVSAEELITKLHDAKIVPYKGKTEVFESGGEEMQAAELLSIMDFTNKDEAGYNVSVKIGDTQIEAEEFAEAVGLKSTHMEVEKYEKGIRITTKGEGHGFGMSITGACALAKEGLEHEKILKKFYNAAITK